MSKTAADVPADDAILCEACGYTLDGLPLTSNCPECGKPIAESASDGQRQPPAWESPGGGSSVARFWKSTGAIIFRTSHFFRTSTARGPLREPWRFALLHWGIAAILFGTAAAIHWWWYANYIYFGEYPRLIYVIAGMAVLTFLALWMLTRLAASLTTWEARYRGYRLPRTVVLRGLYYHAAHYLPVALVALATTLANAWLWRRHVFNLARFNYANAYLWCLSVEVVGLAMYLFWTYWAAMRNMMYANR
jgi:hypothetical protein